MGESSFPEVEGEQVRVLIYRYNDEKQVGIIVDKFEDAVLESTQDIQPPGRLGIKGSLIINDKVAELVDVGLLNQMIVDNYPSLECNGDGL